MSKYSVIFREGMSDYNRTREYGDIPGCVEAVDAFRVNSVGHITVINPVKPYKRSY